MSSYITLSRNILSLRESKKISQEKLAEVIGVSRQTIAKWENNDSIPDIRHCDILANYFNVSLDNLIHYDERKEGLSIPPKGKHMFGTVVIEEQGKVVLPKEARVILNLKEGDKLVVLADENPETLGIALVPCGFFMNIASKILNEIDNR